MYAIDSKSIRAVIVGVIASGLLQVAHALGLGPITVNSHIGEPLQATINVTGLDAAERAKTNVSIADNQAYISRGIEKLPSHDQLSLSLQSSARGDYISISTPNVVREPFITFVLSVKHAGKETLREYTVFLDPATDGLALPATSSAPAVKVEPKTIPVESTRVKLLADQAASATASGWKGESPQPVNSVSANAPVRNWEGRSYGPVHKGETLFSIAEKVRPSKDYSIQTVMNQIYRANPRAFNSKQLDSLMAGYALSIPEFTKEFVALPVSQPKTPDPAPKTASPRQEKATLDTPVTEQELATETNDGQELDDLAVVQEDVLLENETDEAELTPANDSEVDDGILTDVETDSYSDTAPAITDLGESAEHDDLNDVSSDQMEIDSNDIESEIVAPIQSDEVEEVEAEAEVINSNLPSDSSADDSDVVSIDSETDVLPVTSGEIPESGTKTVLTTELDEASNDGTNADLAIEEQPVAEVDNNQNFLTTTYAFLPMWQWLVLGVLLLGLIALLLFRQRKKHAVAEYDTLDEAEMDAVLAKINALENDNYQDNTDDEAWLSEHAEEFADLDSQIVAGAQLESDTEYDRDDSAIFDIPENEEADHKVAGAETESLSYQVADQDLNQNEPLPTFENQEIISEDEGLFVSETETATESEVVNRNETDDVDLDEFDIDQPSSRKVDDVVSDDDLDFFMSEDIVETQPTPAGTDEDATDASTSWTNEAHDYDDLFFSDTELGDEPQANAEEAPTDSSELRTPDSELSSPERQFAEVNPEEMEINLDLAVSFIATGHGERAVIWLEEVLEVGTEEQKARAQALMDKVRGA